MEIDSSEKKKSQFGPYSCRSPIPTENTLDPMELICTNRPAHPKIENAQTVDDIQEDMIMEIERMTPVKQKIIFDLEEAKENSHDSDLCKRS